MCVYFLGYIDASLHCHPPVETRQRCNLYIKTHHHFIKTIVDTSQKNDIFIHKNNDTTKKMRRVNVCLFFRLH